MSLFLASCFSGFNTWAATYYAYNILYHPVCLTTDFD